MNSERSVYIVHESVRDVVDQVGHYGKPVILLKDDEGNKNPTKMFSKMVERMGEPQEGDYLVCIGDPVAIGLAFILMSSAIDKFVTLKWNRTHQAYSEHPVNAEVLEEMMR